ASIASAGSLEPLGRYGLVGLPTDTLLSADTAPATEGTASSAPVRDNDATRMTTRRAIAGLLPRRSVAEPTARRWQSPEFFRPGPRPPAPDAVTRTTGGTPRWEVDAVSTACGTHAADQ